MVRRLPGRPGLRRHAGCHWKLDELSIGWDTIDITDAITGRFQIVNDLDENGIDVGEAHPDFVRHRLNR